MLLTWHQRAGQCTKDGDLWFSGYAGGHGGKNPEGVNNPDMDHIPNVGPLPKGRYLIGHLHTAETDGKDWIGHFGPSYIRLTPEPKNEMHGRSGFLVHWDRADRAQHPRSGSDGCICPEEGAFIAMLAQHIGEWLEVVA